MILALKNDCYAELSSPTDSSVVKVCYYTISVNPDRNTQGTTICCRNSWNKVEFDKYLHKKMTECVDELEEKYPSRNFGYEVFKGIDGHYAVFDPDCRGEVASSSSIVEIEWYNE